MEIGVVLFFTLPLVIALAVVAVKVVEFALNRDIASSKVVARTTTILVLGTTVFAVGAWFVYLAIAMSGDPS